MPNSNRKKKDGQRKDKKNARMREDVQRRHENEGEPKPSTDQKDIQTFKPGSAGDRTVDPQNRAAQGKNQR